MRSGRAGLRGAMLVISLAACSDTTRGTEDGGTVDARVRPPTDPRLWIECVPGQERCYQNIHQRCAASGELTQVIEDECLPRGMVCDDRLWCVACRPGVLRCT